MEASFLNLLFQIHLLSIILAILSIYCTVIQRRYIILNRERNTKTQILIKTENENEPI